MEGELNSTYTILYTILALALGGTELAGLKNKNPGDTITEHVRKWVTYSGKSTGWNIRRGGLVITLLWLIAHLGFGV